MYRLNKETEPGTGKLAISRRSLLKAFALAPVSREPLAMLFKEQDIAFTSSVLTYHEVNAARMTSDVVGLIRQGYQPLSLDTFVAALNGDIGIPSNLRTFLVTWDDGLFSQYTQGIAAIDTIERQTGWFVPLTLFSLMRFEGLPLSIEDIPDTTPSFNDRVHRYMTKAQLVEMLSLGHYVENHTIDHIDLTRLSPEQRSTEVELGEARIDELWDAAGRERSCRAFAYPNGRSQGMADYIGSVGYDVAFTTVASTLQKSSQRFALGRLSRS